MTFLWRALLSVAVAAVVAPPAQPGRFVPRPYRRPITLWVPPYAVAKSIEQLKNPGVAGGITHLSLQFWVPTNTGQAVLTGSSPEVTEQAVDELRDWAHGRGIRAMLCVYNGAETWDWPLAKAGFAEHRDAFVNSLVSEMDRKGLDGIDVDLEGPADYEQDKPTFVEFMAKLSQAVHSRHKHLTVASFCYKWNAPNQGWWPQLFPLVDGVASMGYADTGISTRDAWAGYAAQVQAAGVNAAKLEIGVPSDRDRWQGNSAVEQLTWIKKNGQSGLGIWDAQLNATSWRIPEVWSLLKAIRGSS